MISILTLRGLKNFDEENLRTNEDQKDMEKFLELRIALLMNLALSHFKVIKCF